MRGKIQKKDPVLFSLCFKNGKPSKLSYYQNIFDESYMYFFYHWYQKSNNNKKIVLNNFLLCNFQVSLKSSLKSTEK